MQISYEDNFILLSSDDRAGRRDGNKEKGHLYYIDLTNKLFQPIQLTTELKIPFYPHGISMIRIAENRYRVYAVNHVDGKHSIEVFDLQDGSEGIYVENNFRSEATSEVLDDVIGDINIPTVPQVGGITKVLRRSNRNVKVTVLNNYKLILKPKL